MRVAGLLKRAPGSGALFLFALSALSIFALQWPMGAVAADCAAVVNDHFKVKYVHDGDTIHLVGGQKVRLIGINTPELGRDRKPAEPYGIEARDALRRLLKTEPRIGVQYGQERHDRHGRVLAHLYLSDGRNIQQWLLENGYAIAIVVAPNLKNVDCYRQAEQHARNNRLGLWRQVAHFARDAVALQRGDEGFRLVSGRVTGVRQTNKWSWIALGSKMSLRVARDDEQRYFAEMPLASLKQKQVTARGWLTRRKGRWSMRIMHPGALDIDRD